MGGGPRSAPFLALMSRKRPVRVAHPRPTCSNVCCIIYIIVRNCYEYKIHLCPNLWKGRFQLENKLKMLISENERFCQKINADQRQSSFSAHFQLVLDRTKPIPSFWRRKWKLPCQSVFTENEIKSFMFSLYPELIKLLAKTCNNKKR